MPKKSPPSILLIGNPEPAVEEYPRLPYAGREMALIEQQLPDSRSVVFEGARARSGGVSRSEPGAIYVDPFRGACQRESRKPARLGADSFAR